MGVFSQFLNVALFLFGLLILLVIAVNVAQWVF